MSQQPWQDSSHHTSYQPPAQNPENRSSHYYHQQSNPPYAPYVQTAAQYIQPFYGAVEHAPVVAELPAPLPFAPPTSTSGKQLTEDERLARKLSAPDQQVTEDEVLATRLQHLEVQEARSRSNSNVSQQQRPVSMVLPSSHWTPSLAQQRSSRSLRPHSQSVSVTTQHNLVLVSQQSTQSLRPHSHSCTSEAPWSPASFGPPPQVQSRYSLLPEAIPNQHLQVSQELLPLAVMSDLPEVVTVNVPKVVEPLSSPAAMAAYLEEHRQVPYPPQWRLRPVVKMYHAQISMSSKASWLDAPDSFAWLEQRRSDCTSNPPPAPYTFVFKTKGGSYRDPRFSWVMHCNVPGLKTRARQSTWSYELRLNLNTGVRKTEVLNPGGKTNILTTYVHATNYDSLRFVGNDGRAYLWVSHMPVGSTKGSRYDVLRHALFVATSNHPDPLYGEIVADHTYWDGFVDDTRVHKSVICIECQTKPIVGQRWKCKTCPDHNICGLCDAAGAKSSIEPACKLSLTCLPDETLYIRSSTVDHALVIASLQVLKDWQKHEFRRQKSKDPKGFTENEEFAREQDLGKLSYWRGSDLRRKNDAPQRVKSRAETAEAMQNPNGISGALGNLMDAGLAIAAQGQQGGHGGHHSGQHTYGGDAGGGGGDGGGGGG